MDAVQRTLLQVLVENDQRVVGSSTVPISCKGRKNIWGQPEVWNDREGKCKPVSRRTSSLIKTAQFHSAKSIGTSMGTQIGKEKHEDAAKHHEVAAQHHAATAHQYHKEGFYSAAKAHATQAKRHLTLKGHHQAAHQAAQPKGATDGQKSSTPAPAAVSASGSKSSAHRDHRGRFIRRS